MYMCVRVWATKAIVDVGMHVCVRISLKNKYKI